MKEIQNYISNTVAKRDKIWQECDQAVKTKEDLINRYANQFDVSGNGQTAPNLTPQNLPPDEIKASLSQLEKIEGRIAQEKARIKNNEDTILSLKIRTRNLIIGSSVAGVIFLVIVIGIIRNQFQNNKNSPHSLYFNLEKASRILS